MQKKSGFWRWWFSPLFPLAQFENVLAYRPKGFLPRLRNWYRTWVIHPVKRRLAKYYLLFLKHFYGLKVVAITGSAGKTTTKEMVTSILKLKAKTVSSLANIDPIYNIPATILKCRADTKYLVLEMGVEYPGEMDFYLWLAKPDIAVITNIYPTHTLYFKSVEGVAREKIKLAKGLEKGGVAILNIGNNFRARIARVSRAKVFWYGDGGKIFADEISYTKANRTKYSLHAGDDEVKITLPILGRQFVENSLAASSVGYLLGVSSKHIKRGLEKIALPDHRMRVKKLRSGAIIIDDSYNNNPAAAKQSLKVFEELSRSKSKIIVFGDMLELGKLEVAAHKEIGRYMAALRPKKLICVGPLSALTSREAKRQLKERVVWVASAAEARRVLKANLTKDSLILVKGSRALGLDKIVSGLS